MKKEYSKYNDEDQVKQIVPDVRKERKAIKTQLVKEVGRVTKMKELVDRINEIISSYVYQEDTPINRACAKNDLYNAIISAGIVDKEYKLAFEVELFNYTVEFKPSNDYTKQLLEDIMECEDY